MAAEANANALVLSVSADTSKALKELEKLNKKLDGLNDNAVRVGKKTQKSLDGLFGNPAKALDKVFDSTRFKILDSGVARVGLFGSSLEKLGVVGLAAAAAIGAVAFALNQAGEAIKFADELEDTANRLHVTTDALQEYRFAIRAAGGDEKGADQALEAFSQTLGKASLGLPKALKGFQELFGKNFTAEDVKRLGDTESALRAVVARISELKSDNQKDAIVDQLGLGGVKQLAEGGVEQLDRFMANAKAAGVVMDASLIRRASGLQDQLETINKRIDVDMKSAFVGIGPEIIKLKTMLAGLLETVLAVVDGWNKLPNQRETTLRRQLAENQVTRSDVLQGQERIGGTIFKRKLGPMEALAESKRLDLSDAMINNQLERFKLGDAANVAWDKAANPPGGRDAYNVGKSAGPSAASQQKHFDEALAKVAEQILSASDDELHTLEERQAIARRRLVAEDGARRTAIADEVQTKAITDAQADVLLAKQDEVLKAKSAQLQAQQAQALQAMRLRQEQDLVGAVASLLDAQLGLTRSAEERGQLEAQILAAQRSIARKLLVQDLANDPNKSQAQKNVEISAFDATSGALAKGQDARTHDAVAAQRLSVEQAGLDAQIDALSVAGQLAETAKARRSIELQLLDLQDRKLRAEYEGVLASETASKAEQQIAQKKLDELNATASGRKQGVLNNTRGPMEQFKAGLPLDPDKYNEALQRVKAGGLQSLEDGLVGVITHTKKLGDVFREVAAQIVADLARIAIQQAIIGPLSNLLTGGMSSIGGFLTGHRAGGGPVDAGKAYEVGERGREIFVPDTPGRIIPHNSISAVASMAGGRGGMTQVVNQYFQMNAPGAIGFREFREGLSAEIRRTSSSYAAAAYSAANHSAPGAMQSFDRLQGS